MTYNLHPIFVHFPIAFLLLYSLMRILPAEKWLPRISWKALRLILITFGEIAALIAQTTGETAEHLGQHNRQILEMHSLLAQVSVVIYAILLTGELLFFLNHYLSAKIKYKPLLKFLEIIEKIFSDKTLAIILSTAGLITISLTGLLGGVMVYGVSADPLAPIILKFLKL